MSPHLSEELFSGSVDGVLTEDERAAVAGHVALCAECAST
ncbi:MAG: zf-HC2 domain-containing protein, partial [Candidatus Dormibacteria bacterium]